MLLNCLFFILLFCFICVPGPLLFYGVRNKHSVHPTFSAFIATDLIYRLKEKCLSLPPVVCLIYVICVCLCTVVPNAYCVVFFFVLCTLGFYDSTFLIVPFCIFYGLFIINRIISGVYKYKCFGIGYKLIYVYMLKVVNLDVYLLDTSVHPVYYIYYKIPDIFYRSRILYI